MNQNVKSKNSQKLSKTPEVYPIEDVKSEMGASGGWVVAGPMGNNDRVNPAYMDLEKSSTNDGKIENKARLDLRQDPSLCLNGENNLRTDVNLACKVIDPNVILSDEGVVNCIETKESSAQSSNQVYCCDDLSDRGILMQNSPVRTELNQVKVDDSRPPQCHLCGVIVNANCNCQLDNTATRLKMARKQGAIPKLRMKINDIDKETEKSKDTKVNNEVSKVRKLVEKYDGIKKKIIQESGCKSSNKESRKLEVEVVIDKAKEIERKLQENKLNKNKKINGRK